MGPIKRLTPKEAEALIEIEKDHKKYIAKCKQELIDKGFSEEEAERITSSYS